MFAFLAQLHGGELTLHHWQRRVTPRYTGLPLLTNYCTDSLKVSFRFCFPVSCLTSFPLKDKDMSVTHCTKSHLKLFPQCKSLSPLVAGPCIKVCGFELMELVQAKSLQDCQCQFQFQLANDSSDYEGQSKFLYSLEG